MKQRSMFILGFIVVAAGIAAAQTRTVTNADLEKYRQERLKAEREYRENYATWGFSSPEELDRRREQSRIETEQLSAKLRAERLEREHLEAERLWSEQAAAAYYRAAPVERGQPYTAPGYFRSYGRRYAYPVRRHYSQPGYFAGGQFWPTPGGIRPRLRPSRWIPKR